MRGNVNYGVLTGTDYLNKQFENQDRIKREELQREVLREQARQFRAKTQRLNDPNYVQGQRPASLQEFDAYQQMTPDQQKTFDRLQRATPEEYWARRGAIVNPSTGQVAEHPTLGSALGAVQAAETRALAPAQAEAAALKERAVTGSSIKETSRQEALRDLPQFEANANQILNVLGDIEGHPGLSAVVGAPEITGGRVMGFDIPGTRAADFTALTDRLRGQQFTQAFESLKGAGQITEAETAQAIKAQAAMSEAQTEKQYLKGLNDFRNTIMRSVKRNRLKAGINPTEAPKETFTSTPNKPVSVKELSFEELEAIAAGE